jgi:hypothetical protein
MTATRTYLRPQGTFSANDTAAGTYERPAPTVVVPKISSMTTSVGVHVRGSVRVEAGKAATGISVMLDPVALRRKISIDHMERELHGIPNSKTTKR